MCAVASTSLRAGSPEWISAGPFGGNAEVIVASPSNPRILFAGTKNANLFRSTNAGESWQSLSFPRQYSSMLHTLVVDPENPAVVYAAIADEPRCGLYRTTDSGQTWKPLSGVGVDEVYSVALWHGDRKVMVAGLRQSVRVSRDGGETWKTISAADNTDMQPAVSVAFDPENADLIYVGTPRLPWKTTDGGQNWNLIAEGMSTDSDIITVRVDSTKPSRVFIGACSGFWRSNNRGELWSKMAGIPFTSRRTYAFAQDPDRPELIFAGTSRGLYRTTDGGAEWRNISSHEIKSLAIAGGTLFIATADAGLFKSSDRGSTLQPIDDGFTSRNFSRVSESGEQLYTGTGFEVDAGTVFSSSDGGVHWTPISDPAQFGNESVTAIARTGNGTLMAATASGIFRSTDLGKTWKRAKGSPLHITALCALDRDVLAGTESGLFRSSDEGQTWVTAGASDTKSSVRAILHADLTVALLAHSLIVSADEGRTWSSRHLPFFTEVYDLAASRNYLLAGTSRGVFHSEDGGETWNAAKVGVPNASITSVAIDPRSPSRAFAFEYGNFYETRDAGVTWRREKGSGLQGAFVRNFVIPAMGPHNLIAVTATRGIFVRDIDEGLQSRTSYSTVDTRKDQYVPNQQNDKTPAL